MDKNSDWFNKIVMVAQCTEPLLANPLTGEVDVSRKFVLALVSGTDILVVVLFMLSCIFID